MGDIVEFKFQFYCSTSKGREVRLSGPSPIVLDNFHFKVVINIIFKRSETTASKVILPNQFEFVNGRQIQNAIVMASDCVNCLCKRCYEGNVVLKIDIPRLLIQLFGILSWWFSRLFVFVPLLDIGLLLFLSLLGYPF